MPRLRRSGVRSIPAVHEPSSRAAGNPGISATSSRRGRQPQEVVALLERIRAEDPQEPFWRGVDRLEASGTHVALDFQLPQDPRLEPVGDVSVACHLYDSDASG